MLLFMWAPVTFGIRDSGFAFAGSVFTYMIRIYGQYEV